MIYETISFLISYRFIIISNDLIIDSRASTRSVAGTKPLPSRSSKFRVGAGRHQRGDQRRRTDVEIHRRHRRRLLPRGRWSSNRVRKDRQRESSPGQRFRRKSGIRRPDFVSRDLHFKRRDHHARGLLDEAQDIWPRPFEVAGGICFFKIQATLHRRRIV